MANNHTPGPWRNARDLHGRIMATIDGREHSVASVHLNDGISAMDSFANARLIAAAPDLLFSLQMLDGLSRREIERPLHERTGFAAFDSAWRAALAKAREGIL